MTDRIEPALTPEEWANVWTHSASMEAIAARVEDYGDADPGLARVIAVANHRLHETDKRKITREMTNIIREAGKRITREGNPYLGFGENLTRYAAALESYLPPEGA